MLDVPMCDEPLACLSSSTADIDPTSRFAEDPHAALSKAINGPPPVMFSSLRDGARVTRRWIHGSIHHLLPPMREHVVIALHSGFRPLSWSNNGQRMSTRSGPNRIIVIPRGHAGRLAMEGPVAVSHIYLPHSRIEARAEEVKDGCAVDLIDRIGFTDPVAGRILDILGNEVYRPPPLDFLVEQTLDLLCAHLVRSHSSRSASAGPVRARGLTERQLLRLSAHVGSRLHHEISLAEMADVAGLSRNHFCTAFRLATGLTPYEWLTRERMQEARRRLSDTQEPITEIALAIGYNTPSAFTASFRKIFATTPSSYRRGANHATHGQVGDS